jgi:hypothetical protein
LLHDCAVAELTFFWSGEDIENLLVSLVVMRFILTIPVLRIAINRVGTIDLEYLFGVTKHQTAGNNDAGEILGALVKSNMVGQLADK